ncbi:hypothetical protein [Cellulomonas composti]|uniref:GGDEF domain-containing protein n=1 Tax=Cellulomonas composti TaxID=266130 RepID=A0A511J7L2_9CELL|nr:hypothetical protein [Cellulomonas composti]GEL93992.1 hypothetical protein CCO02nite_06500 [Cellulomonas composti]
MTIDTGPPAAALPRALRERWRDESTASVWRRPSDWYHPAVDELATALLLAEDPAPAAELLGAARAEAGVGIGESIDDLACLYRSTTGGEPPLQVVRALCAGWTDAQAAGFVASGLTDPESGLPRRDYLELRLAECFHDGTAADHRLLVLDVAAGVPDPFARMARSAAVGSALQDTFGAGQPMASLGGGVFVVLLRPQDDDGQPLAAELITERAAALDAAAVTRSPVRSWTEPLASSAVLAVDRLAHLLRV